MRVFDASFLLLAIRPHSPVAPDPATGKVIDGVPQRIDYLIKTLSETGQPILVPTPVLAEVFVVGGAAVAADFSARIRRIPGVQVVDFDFRASVECALLTSSALAVGRKRGAAIGEPWQKVKIDRQIVAIAKCHEAQTLYTTDGGLKALAEAEKIDVQHVADLPLPPIDAQVDAFPEDRQ